MKLTLYTLSANIKQTLGASLLCLIFFFLDSNVNMAFSQHEIQVISEETNLPIENAKVIVATSSSEETFTTDENGLFKFTPKENIPYNEYRLKITADGFEPYEFKYDGKNSNICPMTPTMEKIDNVVVTGQISMTTQDKSVNKIQIIDRKTIDAKGAVNLRDVLNNELSIRVTQDQMLGSGIQMQGFSGENVKILIDGVPVIGRMNGNIDLSQINLNDIERVEIVEGPLSVNYGSDALAGTINLITKRNAKPGFQAGINSYYETVGNYNLDSKLTYNLKHHRFSISGMRNFFDGWNPGDPFVEFPKSKIADTNRVMSWKPKEQYQLGLQYTLQYKRFSINPFADFFWETLTNRGMPFKPDYVRAFDNIFKTERQNQGINFNAFIGQKYKLQGVVAHNYYERRANMYVNDLTTLVSKLANDPSEQDTSMFRTIMSRATFASASLSQKIDYEVGYDLNFNMAKGKRIADSSKTMGDYAIFGAMEWKAFKEFVVRPAARLAYNSVFGFNVIPSLNFKYGIKDWTFRLSYAKGYRAPGMKELYMDFVDSNHDIHGNPKLKAEQSHNYQLSTGYHLDLPKTKQNDGIDFDLGLYYQNVKNKIELSQDALGVHYSYFNLSDFESLGGKFNVGYKNEIISAKVGTSVVNVRTSFDQTGFHATPEFNASFMYTLRDLDMNFAAFYKYSGEAIIFIETATGLSQTKMGDYNMLDVSVSKSFWKRHITLAVGAKNLLNVTNITSSSNDSGAHSGSSGSSPIAWGRSMYVKLSFNFDTYKSHQR